jgi:ribosome-associated protein
LSENSSTTHYPPLIDKIKLLTSKNPSMIKLDQFLKLVGIAPTGGQAKLMIVDGDVKVNGTVETRRGRKLVSTDQVIVAGQTFDVGDVISDAD